MLHNTHILSPLTHLKTRIALVFSLLCIGLTITAAVPKTDLGVPDLKKIKAATTDPTSKYYYPTLVHNFLSNDTIMKDQDFQYLYYGTLFQEDYDPYRPPYDSITLAEVAPLYAKATTTRSERQKMEKYAKDALRDNPVSIRQLTNLVYVYEKNNKFDLAKIWRNKLHHLLLVIAKSGTGADAENAWLVVYPAHEYDVLTLSGRTIQGNEFVAPSFDVIHTTPIKNNPVSDFYFNIAPMLEQYYLKHPTELTDAAPDVTDRTSHTAAEKE